MTSPPPGRIRSRPRPLRPRHTGDGDRRPVQLRFPKSWTIYQFGRL